VLSLGKSTEAVNRQERETIIDAAGAVATASAYFGASGKETELAIKRLCSLLDDITGEKSCERCSCQAERIYDC
jgi:hypothetical protein